MGRARRGRLSRRVLVLLAVVAICCVAAAGYVVLRPRSPAVTAAPLAADPACARVAARWPERVAGQDRVDLADDVPAAAAWGDPAVVARCGVAPPPPTTRDCISADGVDWVATGSAADPVMVFVSYGRSPAIEVTVPAAYAPQPLVLGAFAPAAGEIDQGDHRCR